MIDLEGLASARSRDTGESDFLWLSAVRQEYFERACSVLSDGEILFMFMNCQSAKELAALAESVANAPADCEPIQLWKKQVEAAGITPKEAAKRWAEHWEKSKDFTKCLKAFSKPTRKNA